MRDVRRPDSQEPLVERLTSAKMTEVGTPVFETIMDLLIFAASVGFAVGRRSPVPVSGKAVPVRIFENNNKEGYIFMLALAETKDPSVLAVENDDETVRIFEEYAAGGLEEIASWLAANPTDISGVQALISRIQAQLPERAAPSTNPSPI
jgi:dnd system-associated protein 4